MMDQSYHTKKETEMQSTPLIMLLAIKISSLLYQELVSQIHFNIIHTKID